MADWRQQWDEYRPVGLIRTGPVVTLSGLLLIPEGNSSTTTAIGVLLALFGLGVIAYGVLLLRARHRG